MTLLYAVVAVAFGWALKELLWLRQMKRRLEKLEREIKYFEELNAAQRRAQQ